MNPALGAFIVAGSLLIIAAVGVRFGMGPASVAAEDRLADVPDIDEPVPYLPVDVDPLSPGDHEWLRTYGMTA